MTSPLKNLLSFLAGCIVTFVLSYQIIRSQPSPQVESMAATISQLRAQTADLSKQRDTCNAKFERATILYDVGLFNVETRAWVIPADVEPVLAPNKNGSYSHYDPKTQTETVHFKGKPAQ
jgi:hypothetical protein